MVFLMEHAGGSSEEEVMERGQEAAITGMVDDAAGMKVPIFSEPEGHLHIRQIGTFDYICSGSSI